MIEHDFADDLRGPDPSDRLHRIVMAILVGLVIATVFIGLIIWTVA
ncbi:hypothetical protein [Mesorhizobium hungaricum]|jgi:hypothetical protein|nr:MULTISPECIES: hypothetical protein [Mesorhizobium]MBN9236026.1 hypothetical protein [Mesorhizobium sp.]